MRAQKYNTHHEPIHIICGTTHRLFPKDKTQLYASFNLTGSMRSSTPTALMEICQKVKIHLKGKWECIIFWKLQTTAIRRPQRLHQRMCMCFFIFSRRVQRYRTAVRGGGNKKHIHRRHKILCVLKNIIHTMNRYTLFAEQHIGRSLKISLNCTQVSI